MSEKFLNTSESNAIVHKWRLAFSAYGSVLIATLIYLLAFFPQGDDKSLCYILASFSVIGCLHAAKKLRDSERARAAVDAEILSGTQMDEGFGDFDD